MTAERAARNRGTNRAMAFLAAEGVSRDTTTVGKERQVKRTTVTIDKHRFAVPVTSDVSALMGSIEDALRRGGGFVDVPAGPNHTLSVLITPGLTLFVEEEDILDADPARSDSDRRAQEDGSGSYWPTDQIDIDLDV